MNITEVLLLAAAIVPERTAVVFDRERISFALLQERVHRLANAMSRLGLRPGDRVAAMHTNSHHLLEICFAAAQLDAIYVPINFRAKADELATMLSIVAPTLLFLGERYRPLLPPQPTAESTAESTAGNAVIPNDRIVMLDAPGTEGRHGYANLLAAADPAQVHFPQDDGDATTVIMFTSGTTSIPKGAQLTPRQLHLLPARRRCPRRPGGCGNQPAHRAAVPCRRLAGRLGRRLRRAHPWS